MVSLANLTLVVGFLTNTPIQLWTMDPVAVAGGAGSSSSGLTQYASIDANQAPGWMVTDDLGKYLYVANHNGNGGVTVLNVSYTTTSTGSGRISLAYNSAVSTLFGANPVHLAYANGVVYSVSYGDGSFNTWLVLPNATLTPSMQRVTACPNAHQIVLTKSLYYGPNSGSYAVLVPCLGTGQILIDSAETGCFHGGVCNGPDDSYSPPTSGPRHLVVHPTLPLVYLMHEKANVISTWAWDATALQMSRPSNISSLPPGVVGSADQYAGAEITLHPSLKWLYVSNRARTSSGNSSIGQYSVDPTTGALTPVAWYTGGGDVDYPRHFTISPDGAWLVVANQNSGTLTVFSVDQSTGVLTKRTTVSTGSNTSQPAFVMFLEQPRDTPRGANGAGGAGVSGLLVALAVALAGAAVVGERRE